MAALSPSGSRRADFTIYAGRRNGDQLKPLYDEIAAAGGSCTGRSLDARKEEDVAAFLREADEIAPLEVCVFNIGGNVNTPLLDTTERVFRKVWEMACYAGFLTGREAARQMLPRGQGLDLLHRGDGEPARRQSATRPSPAPNSACARWRRAWRGSSGRRTSTSPIW